MKQTWVKAIVVSSLTIFPVQQTQAVTPEAVRLAVAKGAQWLASRQDPLTGTFSEPHQPGVTGLAVHALMHYATDPRYGLGLASPFDPRNPFKANIEKGLDLVLSYTRTTPNIPLQPAGDPDVFNDDRAVYLGSEQSYYGGIALMMLCSSVELNRLSFTGETRGWPYWWIARDIADHLYYGQIDEPSMWRGGWGYTPNAASADNSNSGIVTMGLVFAVAPPPSGCGFEIPQWVKEELNIWVDYIQNDVIPNYFDPNDGGSGYDNPESGVNSLKTGHLLEQLWLVGDTAESARVKQALDYLARWWRWSYDYDDDPGWRGNYHATWSIMKGLRRFGIHKFGNPPIDWAADFENYLTGIQYPDGSWPGSKFEVDSGRALSAAWALLTLLRAAPTVPVGVPVDVSPGACPNKLNLASKGQTTVVIAGAPGFDVTTVDPTTVMVEGVRPIKWTYKDVTAPYEPYLGKPVRSDACLDVRRDGWTDLAFEVDTAALGASLNALTVDGEIRALKLKGYLKAEHGGSLILGEDIVVISKK